MNCSSVTLHHNFQNQKINIDLNTLSDFLLTNFEAFIKPKPLISEECAHLFKSILRKLWNCRWGSSLWLKKLRIWCHILYTKFDEMCSTHLFFYLSRNLLLLLKVVVTFYLRLRNEFQPFPAKNQASDWLTSAGQPIRGLVFGRKWL